MFPNVSKTTSSMTVVNDDGLVADLDFYEPNLHVAMGSITSLKQNRNKHYFNLDLMNKYTGMTETCRK